MQDRKKDTDMYTRLLDSEGEVFILQNSTIGRSHGKILSDLIGSDKMRVIQIPFIYPPKIHQHQSRQHIREVTGRLSCSNVQIQLPYDPAIPLLGIHTEETRTERDMCTPMFIAALFRIARTWKQPRCPSADEWIRKLWYIYTMEYYSAVKKNSFESVLMRWVKLEPIIQSEVSQKEKHQYSILTHIYGI